MSSGRIAMKPNLPLHTIKPFLAFQAPVNFGTVLKDIVETSKKIPAMCGDPNESDVVKKNCHRRELDIIQARENEKLLIGKVLEFKKRSPSSSAVMSDYSKIVEVPGTDPMYLRLVRKKAQERKEISILESRAVGAGMAVGLVGVSLAKRRFPISNKLGIAIWLGSGFVGNVAYSLYTYSQKKYWQTVDGLKQWSREDIRQIEPKISLVTANRIAQDKGEPYLPDIEEQNEY